MAAATLDPPVSKGRRRHPDLIFEWIVSTGHRWRLLLFLNLSLALHVACFYAFKVIYAPNVRQRPETTKVTFLDPREDPGVRAVIGRIEDRAVFFDGSLRLPVPGASLEDDRENEVVPTPGFANYEPSLANPPEIDLSSELPHIFATDDIFLPPQSRLLPGGKRPPRPEPFMGIYIYKPRLLAMGDLGALEIVSEPDWSESQEAFAAAVGNRIQFLIEVGESGKIANCLPWAGVETVFDASMARQIESGLVFAPSDEVSRGWLEMRW
jgi:hypothetical protein